MGRPGQMPGQIPGQIPGMLVSRDSEMPGQIPQNPDLRAYQVFDLVFDMAFFDICLGLTNTNHPGILKTTPKLTYRDLDLNP